MDTLKTFSVRELRERILKVKSRMECENILKAKQGEAVAAVDHAIYEMMFIYTFLPYWNIAQRKQKECYLNEKYKI